MSISGVSSGSSDYVGYTQRVRDTAERISSGMRINHAADDAAGLAIGERLNRAVSSYTQSIRNANDGVSMLQTAEAGLSGITEGIGRIRELALQASNGTLNSRDRDLIQGEASQMLDEMQRSLSATQFNQKPLLSGDQPHSIQLGESSDAVLNNHSNDAQSRLLESGVFGLDLGTVQGAMNAIDVLDLAQGEVDLLSADIGASLNRIGSTINQLSEGSVQSAAAKSRITDADMAKEISDWVNAKTQEDMGLAVQSLANQQQGNVLRLLQSS